jgi:hypothetical protein
MAPETSSFLASLSASLISFFRGNFTTHALFRSAEQIMIGESDVQIEAEPGSTLL